MLQFYTLEEVKLRNGQNGARTWIVVHDSVYDTTDYLTDVRMFLFYQYIQYLPEIL